MLSSDDPVRVFQRFSTVDALSNGRAEVILGRGSFAESFPLFGFELAKYEELFEEKLDLFAALLKEEPLTWSGNLRTPLTDQEVFPKTESGHLKTWIGVGGSPESVVRAARYNLPLVLAIIGGDPERFAPYADLFHRALDQMGHDDLPIAVHSPGYVADTDEQALTEFWPHFKVMRDRIGRERGWPPAREDEFAPRGRARLALRRIRRDGGQEDREHREDPRDPALRPQVQRRHPAPRADAQQHPALRREGRADGARPPRLAEHGATPPASRPSRPGGASR